MSKGKDLVEQRKHTRFRVMDGIYAALGSTGNKLGQIINVSRGGLAFRYIDIGERPDRMLELEISPKDNGFGIRDVLFQTIFDSEASSDFPFASTPMRRRGGRFITLTREQISDLEYFIQNYTVGAA